MVQPGSHHPLRVQSATPTTCGPHVIVQSTKKQTPGPNHAHAKELTKLWQWNKTCHKHKRVQHSKDNIERVPPMRHHTRTPYRCAKSAPIRRGQQTSQQKKRGQQTLGTIQRRAQSIKLATARALLVWQPPQALQQLCAYRRRLLLESIWVVRCASEGHLFSSTAIIHKFKAMLQWQLTLERIRTQGDVGLKSGVPVSWLRGCNQVLPAERFDEAPLGSARACPGDLRCYVDGCEGWGSLYGLWMVLLS
jgi:hypothetical protein